MVLSLESSVGAPGGYFQLPPASRAALSTTATAAVTGTVDDLLVGVLVQVEGCIGLPGQALISSYKSPQVVL